MHSLYFRNFGVILLLMSKWSTRFLKVAVPAIIGGTGIELILWWLKVPERVFNVVGIATMGIVIVIQWARMRRDS